MVERELGRHAVVVGVDLAAVLVHERVHVVAVREHAPVLVQPVDLVGAPLDPLAELAGEDPVDGEVRAGRGVGADRASRPGTAWPCTRGVATKRVPATFHAPIWQPGVEVVALVPAVVRDLVALVRLDHRDERAAELDRLLAGVAGAHLLDVRGGLLRRRVAHASVLSFSYVAREARLVHLVHRGHRELVERPRHGRVPCSPRCGPGTSPAARRASGGRPGSAATTNAPPISPSTGSGSPTTATWATVGMVGQHGLDLARVHVVPAADVHLLQPADDPHVAVGVERAEVAGV